MRLRIEGHHLPGRHPGGHRDVQVGVQVRSDPTDLVRADAATATWTLDIDEVDHEGTRDFRGPTVHGRRGERFVYLTWLEGADPRMFRRAKLMLGEAPEGGAVVARVDLTDELGLPRCARLRAPALEWRVGE